MLTRSGIIGARIPTTNDFFMSDGSSFPWSQPDIDPPHLYVSSTNTTWFFWEGWQPVSGTPQRVVECGVYNHTTKQFSGPYLVGTLTIVGDLHGVPTVARDSNGYIYCFYGSHTSWVQLSSTALPDNPTNWINVVGGVANNGLGDVTFPKPYFVGTNLFLFFATTSAAPYNEDVLSVMKCTGIGGVPSWTPSPVQLFFFSGGWVQPGTFWQNGTDIHITLCYATQYANWKQDLFYAIYDTVTGNLRNYNNSVIVAPASQPISLATAQTSFRIVDQLDSTKYGNQPTMALDAAGDAHFVCAQTVGTSSGAAPFDVLHVKITGPGAGGASISSPHTVYSFAGSTVNPVNFDAAIVPNATSGVGVYFADGTINAPNMGGNILSATRTSGGSWTSATQFKAAIGGKGFDCPTAITNPNADARFAFTQVSSDYITIDGQLEGFAFGDAGPLLIPKTASTFTGGAYFGPGDLISSAAGWWGLRAYSVATAGTACCDIVRASDSTTLTINSLVNGRFDTASATSFLQGTTGKVSKLYDQSGNTRHAIQTTDANRPAFSLTGGPGGGPAMIFASGNFLIYATGITSAQPFTMSAVCQRTGRLTSYSSVIGSNGGSTILTFQSTNILGGYAGITVGVSTATPNVWHSIQVPFNGVSSVAWSDNARGGTGSIGAGTLTGAIRLGDDGNGDPLVGAIAEAGIWLSALSLQQYTALDNNQHGFWKF